MSDLADNLGKPDENATAAAAAPTPEQAPGAHADVAIVCPQCLEPNPEDRHFCRRCATPLTAYASIDPLGQIYAAADTYRKAIANPRRVIVILGLWLLFGPAALIYLLLVATNIGSLFGSDGGFGDVAALVSAMAPPILLLHATIAAIILFRSTNNMLRLRREQGSAERQEGEKRQLHDGGSAEDQSSPGGKPLAGTADASTSGEAPDAAAADVQLRSDAELLPTNDDVRELMQDEHPPYAIDTSDPLYGSAFLHFLLFDRYPFLLHRDLGLELDDEGLVYNRYYWFTRFCGLYRARHGEDARLDRQT
jgi:hypothetical protein